MSLGDIVPLELCLHGLGVEDGAVVILELLLVEEQKLVAVVRDAAAGLAAASFRYLSVPLTYYSLFSLGNYESAGSAGYLWTQHQRVVFD